MGIPPKKTKSMKSTTNKQVQRRPLLSLSEKNLDTIPLASFVSTQDLWIHLGICRIIGNLLRKDDVHVSETLSF